MLMGVLMGVDLGVLMGVDLVVDEAVELDGEDLEQPETRSLEISSCSLE